MSGAPASVTLKSISVIPFHNSHVGVISDESHFKVVLSVSTKLRNDSEKDSPNVVILFKAFALHKKKRMVNETMEQQRKSTNDSGK